MNSIGRRVLSSGNLLLTLVLLGTLFIFVNFISSRRYGRVDLTRAKFSVVSEKTVLALRGLAAPVSVVVFYQPQTPEGRPDPLYPLITNLLQECERHTDKLKIEYVEPYRDRARAEQLAKEFAIDKINIVAVRAGARRKYLSDTDLAEYDYEPMQLGRTPRVKTFTGEEAFTSAILSVTQAKAPLVWFTTGHGEKSVDATDPLGLSDLKRYLEQQNMVITPVTLLEHSAIPPEVELIVVAGPTRRFTEGELLLLAQHLQEGGRVLALIDPLQDTGLDGLLARWGIDLGGDIVVDPSRQLPFVSAANLFVTTYTQHPIVEKMQTLMTLFPLARSVHPADPPPEGLTVAPLALTSDAGWGETNTAVSSFQFNEGTDRRGPVSIAVAAERSRAVSGVGQAGLPAPPAGGAQAGAHTRLVVIGDSDFVLNSQLGNVGNRDFLLGSVYWLAEQEQMIGISPKPLETIRLTLTHGQLLGLFWFSLLVLPLAYALLGVGMWWIRRV